MVIVTHQRRWEHEKNPLRTGGEFHVNSAGYPLVMPGGMYHPRGGPAG